MSTRNATVFAVAIGAVLTGALALAARWQLDTATARTVESSALLAAASYASALGELRSVYTSEVVNRLPGDVTVTHDYLATEGAIPLPATLTITLAERLGVEIEGLRVRLYSEYPFPWRLEGAEMDGRGLRRPGLFPA